MRQGCRESYRYFIHQDCMKACYKLRLRQAKMEMETEDDVAVEGSADSLVEAEGLQVEMAEESPVGNELVAPLESNSF